MNGYSARMTVVFAPLPHGKRTAWREAIGILAEWMMEIEMAEDPFLSCGLPKKSDIDWREGKTTGQAATTDEQSFSNSVAREAVSV